MTLRRPIVAFAALMILLTGCRDPKVAPDRAPQGKNPAGSEAAGTGNAAPTPPAMAAAAIMASTPVATAEGAGLKWTAPAHWKPKPLSAMRKASFTVPGDGGADADLSITAFPGDVGGEVANVNRWRGQVSLPPLAEVELTGTVARLAKHGLSFAVVDCAGTGAEAQQILGAIVPFGGATWFFKLMGPAATVAREKPVFLDFLNSVTAAAPAAP